jgi:hypothetical protein
MNKPKNVKLYENIKQKAKNRFERYPSIYASSWIVKEYKKAGGRYISDLQGIPKNIGLKRWYSEKWIQVEPYLTSKKIINCGDLKNGKACRPLVRINSKTPITIPELLKIHNKKTLIRLAKLKKADMKGRIYWKKGKFFPSK